MRKCDSDHLTRGDDLVRSRLDSPCAHEPNAPIRTSFGKETRGSQPKVSATTSPGVCRSPSMSSNGAFNGKVKIMVYITHSCKICCKSQRTYLAQQ
jgi:hypothetical protein